MQYSDDLTDVPVANNLVEMREDPRLGCQFPRPKTSHPFGEDAGSSLVAHLKSRWTRWRNASDRKTTVWAGHMEP